MSRKNCKQLVIDANLTYASGDFKFNPMIDLEGPSAPDRSRQCLQAIFDEGHIAVFGRNLYGEWNRHVKDDSYAREWFKLMQRKSRVLLEDGDSYTSLYAPACACLANDGERDALRKDFHLLQSALATGQLILSREVNLPRIVRRTCGEVKEFASLYYGNPVCEGDDCRRWIKAGAEKDADRRIDVWAENHLKTE